MGLLKKFGRKAKPEDGEIESVDFRELQFETGKISSEPEAGVAPEVLPENTPESTIDMSMAPIEESSEQVREIHYIRDDMARMLKSLRDSMRVNQDTVAGIEKISRFLQIAEMNALSLERLRPENATLKTKLENIRSEISRGDLRAHELESKVAAYKARFDEANDELDVTRARLIEVEERLSQERSSHKGTVTKVEKLRAERRELLVSVEDLQRERENLQEDFQSISSSGSDLNQRITELVKRSEHLSAQVDDERRTREAAVSKFRSLKLDHNNLQAEHAETLSKLDMSRHETASYHKVLKDYKKRNDDKIFALTSAIENQKTEQKINDDMARYGDTERAKMKSETNLARRRARELEKVLKQNIVDLQENRDSLAKAKGTNEELNDKFLAVLVEVDRLRRENRNQAKKLQDYASMEGVPVGQGFYDDRQSQKQSSARGPLPESEKGRTFRAGGTIPGLELVTEPLKKAK
jgi:predicted  nucleic acid-binding Zn-ribbon protein